MTPQSYLADYGPDLLNLGYPIIPIKRGYKFPKGLKNWEQVEADDELLKAWLANGFADGGVGIICGDVTAVDLDIRDEAITNQLIGYIEHNIGITVQRIGQAPKSLLVFATDNPFSKITSATYTDSDNEEHKVEILGQGQQFVAYAEHPDTNEPYYWVDDHGLADTPKFDLPIISQEQAHDIVEYFEAIVPADWTVKRRKSKSNQQIDLSVPEDVRVLHHSKPPLEGFDDKKVRRALAYITDQSDDYHDWVKVGMALHHQYSGGNDGFAIWDEWSMYSDKYDPAQMRSKWNSFEANLANTNPITFATILKEAKAVYESEKRAEKIASGSIAFLGVSDLMAAVKPIDWMIEGFLEADASGFLYGEPGCYKTFRALDWGLHIATGRDWCGHKVKQAPVLYLSGEGHNGFARRVKAWADHNGGIPADTPFRLAQGTVALSDEKAVKEFVKLIDQEIAAFGRPFGTIIIDTLARNFGPGNENSAEDADRFIGNVERYLQHRQKATVIIVHHTGHANKNRGRGSSAFKGAANFEYIMSRPDDSSNRVCMTGLKMKEAREPEQTWFEAKEVEFEVPGEGTASSLILELSEVPDAAEVSLKGKQKDLYELIQREGPVQRETLFELAEIENIAENRAAVRSALRHLRKKELVSENDNFISILDEFEGVE